MRPIGQTFESCLLVSRQPAIHRLPADAPSLCSPGPGATGSDSRQHCLVPLLSHTHLPHARERDKSAEVVVTHQPKVCDPSAEGLLGPVSRTCTQNLAPGQRFEL